MPSVGRFQVSCHVVSVRDTQRKFVVSGSFSASFDLCRDAMRDVRVLTPVFVTFLAASHCPVVRAL